MLEFTTHNYPFFSRKEIWFYDGEEIEKGTYTVFSAAKKTFDTPQGAYEKYETSIIDLLQSEGDLFSRIHPTFRYDIRAAKKQGVNTILYFNPTKDDCVRLIAAYNLFALDKNLPKKKPEWAVALQKNGNICFSKAKINETEIATHIYIFDTETISLASSFHNVSFKDDKIRGEANKLLHWNDILAFKEKGLKQYDFGGLNSRNLPGVSKFKSNFGGKTHENFRFIKTTRFILKIVSFIKKYKT